MNFELSIVKQYFIISMVEIGENQELVRILGWGVKVSLKVFAKGCCWIGYRHYE